MGVPEFVGGLLPRLCVRKIERDIRKIDADTRKVEDEVRRLRRIRDEATR